MDNQSYYDTFSAWYEKGRDRGYHKMIDDLQVDLVAVDCTNRDVLEVGCGTGVLLRRVCHLARLAVGIDISAGMLEQAIARELTVVQGSAVALPFANESFDVVFSFKVLAHIEDISTALAEVARVLRPGGKAYLEFYNRWSLRYLAKRLAGPGLVASDATRESDVFTRWDRPGEPESWLPGSLRVVQHHGVRVVTPAAFMHKIPLLGGAVARTERWLRTGTPLSRLGGFYVVEAIKG